MGNPAIEAKAGRTSKISSCSDHIGFLERKSEEGKILVVCVRNFQNNQKAERSIIKMMI